ncbi:MAG TPA: arylamine N-acetyltransferase [Terriglobales bacterium]|nr:arylamine N-acetyltransferase [Terriglobales bacterium]
MNLPAYLARIGYTGPVAPTPEVLRALHRAHMLSVPFENLDISRGRKIVVDQDAFVRKIVEEHRGGFCYEMNGAFAALLEAIGFKVTLLSARVARQDGSFGPEFDHLTLRVDLDQPWLADVGFGDSFIEPLRLLPGIGQQIGEQIYRLMEADNRLQLEKWEAGNPWKQMYQFTLQPRQLAEFAGMCHYHQTSPESSFTRKRLCTRATAEGRITLSDMKLVITRDGSKEERMLSSEEEWRAALREYFGVVLENCG